MAPGLQGEPLKEKETYLNNFNPCREKKKMNMGINYPGYCGDL